MYVWFIYYLLVNTPGFVFSFVFLGMRMTIIMLASCTTNRWLKHMEFRTAIIIFNAPLKLSQFIVDDTESGHPASSLLSHGLV